jgi:hypothetical protein
VARTIVTRCSHAGRLWLCVPAAVLSAADGLITLWGQPAAYWSNGFATVCEGNPLAAWILTIHPLAFALSGLPYLALVAGLVLALPRPKAFAVAALVPLSHAFAVALWCLHLFQEPLLPLCGLGLVVAGLAVLFFHTVGKEYLHA